MPHTFDSDSFAAIAADAARMSAGARDHERSLASLADALEATCASDLLLVLGELRVGAREQRRIADSIRGRLIGDIQSANGGGPHRPLVLIVDDSADNRDVAAILLESSGFDAIAAGNGLEALIVAHYTRPAVVIMDVAMPVLDGLQATRLLKASQMTHDINVIAYTAREHLDDALLERLFVHVLRKPASPEAIVGCVQRFAVPVQPEAA